MRAAWATLAVFVVLAAPARADVFAPADPPALAHVVCVAAAGDVDVAAQRDVKLEYVISARVAAGPWRRLSGLSGCPLAAAAPDGTAVVAAGDRLTVRTPGADFGAAIKLPAPVAGLAVAPGGWAAAVGESMTGRLMGMVITPAGKVVSAALDASAVPASDQQLVRTPRIGIDALGNATAVWSLVSGSGRTSIVRFARAAAGGAWAPAGTIGPTAGQSGQVGAAMANVAVAPGGRTLVTWADGDGILASLDGAPATRIAAVQDAGSPVPAIDDAGDALIAYAAPDGLLTADLAPGRGWQAGHRLASWPPSPEDEGLAEADLQAVLGGDGRAAVAWSQGTLRAAARSAGAWAAPVPLSAFTRQLAGFSLALDPSGAPRAVWAEHATELQETTRLQGARLGPGAADTTAPVLTTTLPSRTPRTTTATVTFKVPVRCSETCDAQLSLVIRGQASQSVVRTLAAGRTQVLRMPVDESLRLRLLGSKRLRHPRLRVLVTDRAGNQAQRSRQVAVRVIDRPLRSFEVAPDHDFAMFTKAGDRAVAQLVNRMIDAVATGTTERALRAMYRSGARAIEHAGHGEIYDTEVGDEIFDAISVPCARRGIDPEAILG